jgi:hypothetical protein
VYAHAALRERCRYEPPAMEIDVVRITVLEMRRRGSVAAARHDRVVAPIRGFCTHLAHCERVEPHHRVGHVGGDSPLLREPSAAAQRASLSRRWRISALLPNA